MAEGLARASVEPRATAEVAPQPMIPEMNNVWTPFGTMGEELLNGDVNDGNAEDKTVKMAENMVASGL